MFHKQRRPGSDTTIWALRRDANIYVRVIQRPPLGDWAEIDDIEIVKVNPLAPGAEFGAYTETIRINRKDARLLARRINQCLDATRFN